MNTKKLTILHSNDMHGAFFAETIDERLVGGVSMLSGYIHRARREDENVLYMIAGDMFRGSLIDSEYKGISTIEIMNLLAPDIVTVGNHELDYGIAHLLFLEKCARFPIINANVYIKTTGTRLFQPYKILKVDGMNILVIGIITEDILAQAKREDLIGAFISTEEAAREVERICNAYRHIDIDFTILLTHIGFEEDKELARLLSEASGVDVIIGGHCHVELEQPVLENNILIAHAGSGTNQIGRFDIIVNTDDNNVASYTWERIPIDDAHCPRDIELEQLIEMYKEVTDAKFLRLVTHFPRELTHPQRNRETELGNLFSDLLQHSLGVDIMLLGSGSIRHEKMGPLVLYGNLLETFPYDDQVLLIKVTGQQLKKMMRYTLREMAFTGKTEFYQVSRGLHMVYSRIHQDFDVFEFQGKPVEKDDTFMLGLQRFHFMNFEEFFGIPVEEIRENMNERVISTSCQDILLEELSAQQEHDARIEGRITIKHKSMGRYHESIRQEKL